MNRSPAKFHMRAAALSALGLALLLTAGDALAQERRKSFQNGVRSQALNGIGNQSFTSQRANTGVQFRNGARDRTPRIAPLPQSSPAKRFGNGGGNPSVQFAPLPQTPPASKVQIAAPQTPPAGNGRNGGRKGGGNQSAQFAPLPQTPPAGNGGNGGRKGGGNQSAQFAPLPQTPPANNGGNGAGNGGRRQSNPQLIVAPSAPPAGGNVAPAGPKASPSLKVASLAPAAQENVAPAEAKAVQAEAVAATVQGAENVAVEKPRGVAKDFVVKYEGTFYHVRKTVEDEYKVMGFLDKEFSYHTYARPTAGSETPRPAARRKHYSHGHGYIHAPVNGYGYGYGGY